MKVGIIGAGFTGLAAGYKLAKSGVDVTIIESEDKPGGLALGFRQKDWDWSLDIHYHHWFTSDDGVLNLAKEINHKVIFRRSITSVVYKKNLYQLDSVSSLLSFPYLSFIDRLRTGLIVFYLRYITSWEALEPYTSKKFLTVTMGKKSWKVLWEPLFKAKFGNYADQIPTSWFWARIKKRSAKLGYPEGGFLSFVETLADNIESRGGKFLYKTEVKQIRSLKNTIEITSTSNKRIKFDKLICTLPTPLFIKMTKGLSKQYLQSIKSLKGLGAITLILSLKKKFFSDNTYWLNVNEKNYPFLALIEHTNYIDKKNFNNEHILYVGNYLEGNHRYFKKTANDLVKEFLPYLKKISPKFDVSHIINTFVFKAPFAQPVPTINYSKYVPKILTSVKGLYLANMQQIYPWDRGTNYAIELGEKVADLVIQSQ
jgi:protoporphyrinogen oxidase